MSASAAASRDQDFKPKIAVIGIGGAGGNAVNNMIRYKLEGVDFIVANTDAQALAQSLSERRIQLGMEITQGLGAGSKPEVGRAAAEETIQDIMTQIRGANMVFITAGMGGGTGTGAAPVIARAARDNGILTVGVVTKPFHFEGANRMKSAERGIEELQQYVDTLIVIPNQNLFRVANERTTFADAFKLADDVLYSGVRGVTDLMIVPGLINLDFADIRSVMSEMGKAMMGTGEAQGERRAIEAAEAAISNPLLDDVSMKGARGVLINITGGFDMTLFEVDEAANRIREEVDPDANIIFGSTFDEKMNGMMRVSVVATGIAGGIVAAPYGKTPDVKDATVVSLHNLIPSLHDIDEDGSDADVFGDDDHGSTASLGEDDSVSDGDQVDHEAQDDEGHGGGQVRDHRAFGGASSVGTGPTPQPERKLSFFERLTGVRRHHSDDMAPSSVPSSHDARSAAPKVRVRSMAKTPQQQQEISYDEDSSVDIPAFLRRKGGPKS